MNDPQVILFPHACLSEPQVETVLSLFGSLTIFQPFFMEQPTRFNGREDSESIKTVYPPPHLNPGEEFKTLLSEYYTWMDQNKDRGYKEFLKGYQEARLDENSTWEIREMIRRVGKDASITEKAHTQRWHMILHLAGKIENQRREADELLKTLKQKDSLLKGAIEDTAPPKNWLGDLPQFESEFLMGEHILREVIEAWFALFGGYLRNHELLITFNRDVMNLCSQFMTDPRSEIGETTNPDIIFRFPDLSRQISENVTVAEEIFFDKNKLKKFKNLIREFKKDPEGNLLRLKESSEEMNSSFRSDLFDRTLNITMKYIPPATNSEYPKKNRLFDQLLNKTIIVVEEADQNG